MESTREERESVQDAAEARAVAEFEMGPRPRLYHQRRDLALAAAIVETLDGTASAVRVPMAGLTRGQIQSWKNKCYRVGKRLTTEGAMLQGQNIRVRTRYVDGYLHVWAERV